MNLLLLLLLGSIWGTSFLFIKIVVSEIGPMTLVAGRLGIASLLIWALVWIRKMPLPHEWRLWRSYAVVGLLNGALPFGLISWGEQYIPSGWAALLQATTPIFTILLAHILTQDDRINILKAVGVALGFSGVGMLMWPQVREGVTASVWGMLAIVGSSVSYALASIFAHKHLEGQSPMTSAAGQFTMGFLFIVPFAFLLEQPLAISVSGKALASWITLAVIGTVVAYVIYYTLLARTTATFTVLVTYIVPVNGLILGSLVLGEHLSPMLVVSLALILGGVLLVRR
ncbi:MAG: EamA family transporter [Anaerolineae bacterium]|jgi:drug/metabolite transporter (DMT)-like permease|nr:EamA family transporter [Anaerolineae bacterium]